MTSGVEELLRKVLSELHAHIATVDSPLLSTEQVGKILGRHPKTVLQLVAEKKIDCIRQDPHAGVQFAQKHVDDYLATCEVPAAGSAERKPDRNPKYANR